WRDREGQVIALDDRCPHRSFPLSQGRLMNDTVECGYHGWCFDSSGSCVSIPSQTDDRIPGRAATPAAPVIEQDGLVWLWPATTAPGRDDIPPRTPELVDAGYLNFGEVEG